MRYVSSITTTTVTPTTRQVTSVSAVHAVKPVFPPEQTAPVETNAGYQETVRPEARQQQRAEPFVERRKICRRVRHLPVLEELRSGIERRHHNLREGDVVEHVDESA